MRIAQIAPLWEAVPPAMYGGTERVVHWLTEALVRRGHEVTLFASGDSKTSAELVPVVPRALRLDGKPLADPIAAHVASLGALRERADEFDVVHSHIDTLAFPLLAELPCASVTTFHGRLDLAYLPEALRAFPSMRLVSISDAQREPLPWANWVATVHHGLPLERYPAGRGGGDYAIFVGRISPEKAVHRAIDIASRLGMRLVIAAKVDPADRRYFEEAIVPRLRSRWVEFVGEVGDEAKVELLGDARALLFPIDWPEPFGLAVIEALACGTPVVARRRGAMPEILRHGRTGFLGETDEELAEALRRIDRIDRAACRREAEARFSDERMAADYEAVYAEATALPRAA